MALEDKNTLLEDYINRHNERYKGRLMQDRRS
jgi:hypothetical protein